MPCTRAAVALAATSFMIGTTAQATNQFVLLNPVSPAVGKTRANAISADGLFLTGVLDNSPNFSQAYRWSTDGVASPLGFLSVPGGTHGIAVSNGGTVVAGDAFDGTHQGFRWTASQGMQGIGFLPGAYDSYVRDLSADGSTIVGFSSGWDTAEAFRHTVDGGMQGLGMFSGTTASVATAVSGDGNVIAGYCYDPELGDRIFRWTPQFGMVDLGFIGEVNDMSLDGSAIVGRVNGAPMIWRDGQGLSMLPYEHGEATGVTADGSTVVGNAEFDFTIEEPFIWDAINGGRKLADLLVDSGLNLNGFTLTSVQDISADGTVMTGWGYTSGGLQRGFVAVVPSPPVLALLAAPLAARGRRRRQ